jgi:large subunit ribosomal protein L29
MMMKAEEFKGKSVDELNKMLLDLKKEQVNQRFQKAGGQLEKMDVMRKTRRDVARVKTQLSLMKLGKDVAVKAKTPAKKPAKAKKPQAA